MTRHRTFGASARHAGIRACGATATPARLRGFLLVAALGLLAARPAAAQTEIVEYYGHDALGSIRIVFTASGVATARADYEPFGEGVTIAGMPAGPLPAQQFTGQERDGLERQDYFGARYYRPRHGRFSQVDPVYAGLFDPQQWNRYAYARNNPLGFVDPDGRVTRDASAPGGFDCGEILKINANDSLCNPGPMPTTGASFGVPPSQANRGPAGPTPGSRREPGGRDGSDRKNLIPLVNETTGETTYVTVDELLTDTAKALALAVGLAVVPVVAEATIPVVTATVAASRLPPITGQSTHIFRAAPNHVVPGSQSAQGFYEMLFRLTAAFGRSNPNVVDPNSPMTGRTLNTPLGQVWVHVYNGTIRNAGINPRGSYR